MASLVFLAGPQRHVSVHGRAGAREDTSPPGGDDASQAGPSRARPKSASGRNRDPSASRGLSKKRRASPTRPAVASTMVSEVVTAVLDKMQGASRAKKSRNDDGPADLSGDDDDEGTHPSQAQMTRMFS